MNAEAYVLDHTALITLGTGHRVLSRLVHAAHAEAGRHLYVPAVCLAAAVAQRPGLADHLGSLPAVEVVELGYPGAEVVGRLIADGMDWPSAHAVDVARPDAEWLEGRPLVTAAPEQYARRGVRTVRVR